MAQLVRRAEVSRIIHSRQSCKKGRKKMQELVNPVVQIAKDVLSSLIVKAIDGRFRPIIEEEVKKQVSAAVEQHQPSLQIDVGSISISVMREVYAIAGTSRALDVSNGSIIIRPAFVTKPTEEILPAIFQPVSPQADAGIEEMLPISGQEIKDIVERRSKGIQRIILEEKSQQ